MNIVQNSRTILFGGQFYWPILAYHRYINISIYIVWYEDRLSLSKGSWGVAAGANPSLVSGWGQGTPWTSRQLITGEHWALTQGHFNMQHAAFQHLPRAGIWTSELVDLLYPLIWRPYRMEKVTSAKSLQQSTFQRGIKQLVSWTVTWNVTVTSIMVER